MKKKPGGLGKGISALVPEIDLSDVKKETDKVLTLKISMVEPNPLQPRKSFDVEKLKALAASIEEHGILQPIVVKQNDNGFYTIVAGERRWRAAKMVGKTEVPVIIKEYDDKTVSEVALIENLQREDLNPIEEAMGYERLVKEFNMTQEQLSLKVGKSRSAITNSLRLLNLAPSVQKLVKQQEISAGHARAILAIGDADEQEKAAYLIIEKDWSVRQIENYVNQLSKNKKPEDKTQTKLNIAKAEIENLLTGSLGTKVKISQNKNKGKIEIEFYDKESFDKIVKLLRRD